MYFVFAIPLFGDFLLGVSWDRKQITHLLLVVSGIVAMKAPKSLGTVVIKLGEWSLRLKIHVYLLHAPALPGVGLIVISKAV